VLSLPPSVRVFVGTAPVDGRKGPDSLMTLVRDAFGVDIFTGHLFVFFSKRRDRVRVVYWDRDGIAMWTKRLERGRYRLQRHDQPIRSIEAAELGLMLEGIDLEHVRRRPRWTPRPAKAPAGTPPVIG
jgi:transposase